MGVMIGYHRVFPIPLLQKFKNYYYEYSSYNIEISPFKVCDVPEITRLPKSFNVIVGHAYGSQMDVSFSDFVDNKLDKFLIENSSRIEKLIFTGDVFAFPSLQKWNELFQRYGNIDVHIAPGNHDVERPDSLYVFNQVNTKVFPYVEQFDTGKMIIENSIENRWVIDDIIFELIKSDSAISFIARHDVPVRELVRFWNGGFNGINRLPDITHLSSAVNIKRPITWFIGDSGAHDLHPRCCMF